VFVKQPKWLNSATLPWCGRNSKLLFGTLGVKDSSWWQMVAASIRIKYN